MGCIPHQKGILKKKKNPLKKLIENYKIGDGNKVVFRGKFIAIKSYIKREKED